MERCPKVFFFPSCQGFLRERAFGRWNTVLEPFFFFLIFFPLTFLYFLYDDFFFLHFFPFHGLLFLQTPNKKSVQPCKKLTGANTWTAIFRIVWCSYFFFFFWYIASSLLLFLYSSVFYQIVQWVGLNRLEKKRKTNWKFGKCFGGFMMKRNAKK